VFDHTGKICVSFYICTFAHCKGITVTGSIASLLLSLGIRWVWAMNFTSRRPDPGAIAPGAYLIRAWPCGGGVGGGTEACLETLERRKRGCQPLSLVTILSGLSWLKLQVSNIFSQTKFCDSIPCGGGRATAMFLFVLFTPRFVDNQITQYSVQKMHSIVFRYSILQYLVN
jgi:hypothetical protein